MPIEDEKDWATPTVKETPFWREGMTVDEYEEERNYLNACWNAQALLDYVPLWKQREQQEKNKKD